MSLDLSENISQIEEEIRSTPYHKATEHHVGRLKAKIAKLRDEQIQKRLKSSAEGGPGYAMRKTGDATVVLVGPPSVGKSTLINQITNAQSKVAAYDFTTVGVIPGMMNYQGAKIQIFDLPGIIGGASTGKGRGKEVLSAVRAADLIIIMADVKNIDKIPLIKKELYEFGIRLDEEKPRVYINKSLSGGVKVTSSYHQPDFSLATVRELAQEFKIRNGEIVLKEKLTLDRLIDTFMGNRVYLPYLSVINKIDINPLPKQKDLILISAQNNIGLDNLKEAMWQKLGLIRIFLKARRKKADLEEPLIVKKGKNLRQILENLTLLDKENVVCAKIFGPGAKFPGQEVSLSFVPQEGTIVNFLGG